LIIFILFNICIHNDHVLANGIQDRTSIDNYDDELFSLNNSQPEDIELTRRGVWSRLFRNEMKLPQKMNSHLHKSPTAFDFTLKNGRLSLVPHDKRTIPIELRKALYAHGIVGRRR
jgi:hypothetical protein